MQIKKIFIFTFFITTLSYSLLAQESNLTNMTEFYAEEIKISGFTLDSDQTITVEAKIIALRRNYHDYHLTYAWILNAETREPAWQLSDADQQERDRHTASYQDQIDLDAGTYEVYYSTYPFYYSSNGNSYYRKSGGFFSGLLHALFKDDRDYKRYKYFEDLYDELYLRVNGQGQTLTAEQVEEKQRGIKKRSIISFTQVTDDVFEEQIFKVSEPLKVEVYALGEARKDGNYDFGTIINLKTRERIWQLTYRDSDNAGGARKNRVARQVIKLEPGIYKALYITDDSHSYQHWNEAPPFDPSFWGMSITSASTGAEKSIALLDSDQDIRKAVVVELTKVRDEEYLAKGFTLKKALDLHIYALGEGRNGEMYDYGWIIDAKTRQKVWEMKHRDTEAAGGSSKNRIFDGIVRLEPGNYLAYYITDDSHAYKDWNESAPYDKKSWGMSVFVMDDNYREGDVVAYEEADDPSILARLVRIRDNARKKYNFTMEKDGYVHIYAIGEGMDGDMYDYAWIKDSNTGRMVWEMTYRKTERAGGAKKNRLFDDRVHLEAGNYRVYYETDDSHSFNDWNARPPQDPFNWGVTISLLDD